MPGFRLAAPHGQPSEWLVVPPGRPHRRPAVLPPGTDVMRVEGGRLYAVQTDELDVPRLVAYRVDGLR